MIHLRRVPPASNARATDAVLHTMTRAIDARVAPSTAARGIITVDDDGTFALVRDGDAVTLRDARTLAQLGERARFSSAIISACFLARARAAVVVESSGDAHVLRVSANGARVAASVRGRFARARALGPAAALRDRDDASATTLVDVESGSAWTLRTAVKPSEDVDGAAVASTSRCERWMVFVARDGDGRESARVFRAAPPFEGAVSFRLPAGTDARAIAFGPEADEIAVFDDPCDVGASPALRVFSSDGVARAVVRGARTPFARAGDALVVSMIDGKREGLAWIDELTWRVVRAVEHPLACETSSATRCHRERADGEYERLTKFEMRTIACDANGLERIGVRMAVSRCGSMIASTCASDAHTVLFLWSASASATEALPLAIFIHRKPIVDLKWFSDETDARLVFLCADESAMYAFTPGDETPTRAPIDVRAFSPRTVVGQCGDRADAFILASAAKTFTKQRVAGL